MKNIKCVTSSLVGKYIVLGAALFKNLLTNRMLAKVPLAIIASFPRLEP